MTLAMTVPVDDVAAIPASAGADGFLEAWGRWRKAHDEWSVALRVVNDLEERMARAMADGMDEDAARLLHSATALEQRERKAADELAALQDEAVLGIPDTLDGAVMVADILASGQIDDEAIPVALESLAAGLRRLSAA